MAVAIDLERTPLKSKILDGDCAQLFRSILKWTVDSDTLLACMVLRATAILNTD